MGALQAVQLLQLVIKLHALLNHRVAGCAGFHFRCAQGNVSGVLCISAHIVAVHNLVDEAAFSVQNVPQPRIKAAGCHIDILCNLVIQIALAESPPVPLLHIAGPPWCI